MFSTIVLILWLYQKSHYKSKSDYPHLSICPSVRPSVHLSTFVADFPGNRLIRTFALNESIMIDGEFHIMRFVFKQVFT